MPADPTDEDAAGRRVVLAVLAFTAFCFVYSALAMAPVLVQVAGEYGVSVGRAGLATAAYGLPGLLFCAVVGPLADRFGRKRFLVGGTLALGLGTLTAALAPSFGLLIVGRLVAGTGFALAGSCIQAVVAEHFAYGQRGRAIATVISATSAATIIGIPVSGVLADATSWRVPIGVLAAFGFLACIATGLFLPRSRPGVAVGGWGLYRLVAGHRPAVILLVAGLLCTVPWATWVAYLVVFFQQTFGVSQSVASLAAVSSGLGTLIGSQIGGRLGDRIGHRRVLGLVLLGSCVLVLALTFLPVALAVSTALNLVLMSLVGARNVSYTLLLSEQLPHARATLMAMWSSLTSASHLLGAMIGGLLLDLAGFRLVGLFCFVLSVAAITVLRTYRGTPSGR